MEYDNIQEQKELKPPAGLPNSNSYIFSKLKVVGLCNNNEVFDKINIDYCMNSGIAEFIDISVEKDLLVEKIEDLCNMYKSYVVDNSKN